MSKLLTDFSNTLLVPCYGFVGKNQAWHYYNTARRNGMQPFTSRGRCYAARINPATFSLNWLQAANLGVYTQTLRQPAEAFPADMLGNTAYHVCLMMEGPGYLRLPKPQNFFTAWSWTDGKAFPNLRESDTENRKVFAGRLGMAAVYSQENERLAGKAFCLTMVTFQTMDSKIRNRPPDSPDELIIRVEKRVQADDEHSLPGMSPAAVNLFRRARAGYRACFATEG